MKGFRFWLAVRFISYAVIITGLVYWIGMISRPWLIADSTGFFKLALVVLLCVITSLIIPILVRIDKSLFPPESN